MLPSLLNYYVWTLKTMRKRRDGFSLVINPSIYECVSLPKAKRLVEGNFTYITGTNVVANQEHLVAYKRGLVTSLAHRRKVSKFQRLKRKGIWKGWHPTINCESRVRKKKPKKISREKNVKFLASTISIANREKA